MFDKMSSNLQFWLSRRCPTYWLKYCGELQSTCLHIMWCKHQPGMYILWTLGGFFGFRFCFNFSRFVSKMCIHNHCSYKNILMFILLQQLFTPSKTFFVLIFLHLIFFEAMAYFTMYYFGTDWLPYFASAVLYVIALVGICSFWRWRLLTLDHVMAALFDFIPKLALHQYLLLLSNFNVSIVKC